MQIHVMFKDAIYGVEEFYAVKQYYIDIKTGFLRINYEKNKTAFIKLREIVYFRIFS